MPLFPIETVLFPEGALQLYVSEDKYRQLVRDCLQGNRTFGIVLIRDQEDGDDHTEPFMVGTAVRIEQLHDYEDGRYDIRVHGDHRFRIRKLDYSRPYLVGLVEPLDEVPEDSEQEELDNLAAYAKSRFEIFVQRLLKHLESNVHVVYPDDPTALTFKIANMLQISNIEKQRLLESTSARERLERLIPLLNQHLEDVDSLVEHYQTLGPRRVYRVTSEDLRQWSGPN